LNLGVTSRRTICLLALTLASLYATASEPAAYISIIIDDMGYSLDRGEQAIAIPAPLTYAILPNSTHARSLATKAFAAGKEVMVHLPMENTAQIPMAHGALTSAQPKDDFLRAIYQSLDRVPHATGINNHMGSALTQEPHATGINNHMGSALTQEPQAMRWLMEAIKDRQMYFIDSRTTPDTIAFTTAQSHQLRAASRDIFLDNEKSIHAIDRSFQQLLRLARRKGTAIAIGHPHPITLAYLAMALPKIENIKVVSISELITKRVREPTLAATSLQALRHN
jgi:polysaccharide deacetylase 2 family uncharacterized protein YibQ